MRKPLLLAMCPLLLTALALAGTAERKKAIPDDTSWSNGYGVEDGGGLGPVVLLEDYAVGSAEPDDLPVMEATDVKVDKTVITATDVTLGDQAHYLRSVTLRMQCDGVTYSGKIRAYRDKPTDTDWIVQALLTCSSAASSPPQPLTGIDLAASHKLSLEVTTAKVEFFVDDVSEAELTVGGVKPEEFELCRVEVAGNGLEGVRPSVDGFEAALEVTTGP